MARKKLPQAIHTRDLARIVAEQANDRRIAGKWQRRYTVDEIYDLLLLITDVIGALLSEEREVAILDFGRFEILQRAPRTLRSNLTDEEHSIPPRRSVRFKPFSRLQQLLSEIHEWE